MSGRGTLLKVVDMRQWQKRANGGGRERKCCRRQGADRVLDTILAERIVKLILHILVKV